MVSWLTPAVRVVARRVALPLGRVLVRAGVPQGAVIAALAGLAVVGLAPLEAVRGLCASLSNNEIPILSEPLPPAPSSR